MLYRKLFDMNWYHTEKNDDLGSHCWGAISGGQRNFLEVMQFIGLKTGEDYGKKEIYESDIVFNHTVDRKEAGAVEFSDIHHAYIIRYKAKKQCPNDFDEMHGVEHNLEVIGNIHENPELLK